MTKRTPWHRPVDDAATNPLPQLDDLSAMLKETGLCAADADAAARGLRSGMYLTVEDAVSSRQLWSRNRHLNQVDRAKVAEVARKILGSTSATAEQPSAAQSLPERVATVVRETFPQSRWHALNHATSTVRFHDPGTGTDRIQRFSVAEDGGITLHGPSRPVTDR